MTAGTYLLSELEMEAWGRRIGEAAEPPLVLALRGDLGAGKSTLARAISRGAGIDGPLPSPTFNLLFRYDAPRGIGIAHLDLYRLTRPDEVWELGWAELPASDELVLIEWPERAEELLVEPRWEILLADDGRPDTRSVRVRRVGEPNAIPLPAMPG